MPDERDAIMRSRVAHIVHVGKLKYDELALSFVLAAPKILHMWRQDLRDIGEDIEDKPK